MRLEQQLALNRYFHSLFSADSFEALKDLASQTEGPDGNGHSFFYGSLRGRVNDKGFRDKLSEYDFRVIEYEQKLARARGGFAFKYFQYLSILYTEIYLDRLASNPAAFLSDLNAYLSAQKAKDFSFESIPAFENQDLRKLAFFMATGSGKTLLLHVNLWQMAYYLQHGKHPEALVNRPDGRREFDSILLITPNEGLSEQHLGEFAKSGIDASRLVEDRGLQTTLSPRVKVIEIHKLAEESSKDGVSIVLDELGSNNLVFVDEGHKGTGSEAQTWKNRQKRLSERGFLLEYSATFAQSIGAASKKAQADLISEYGKSILFDYSYRHFYEDGYGKDFHVMNLRKARAKDAHALLLGGFLAFYLQLKYYEKNQSTIRPYNIEKPLWVFLGSSVNAVYTRNRRTQSDVATVVQFLRRLLEEPSWAIGTIGSIIHGNSGFVDPDTNMDLFTPISEGLKGVNAKGLYTDLMNSIFHGKGGLEIWELKNTDGELGLRVSSPEGSGLPYFAVINIGDTSAFKKHLQETLKIDVKEDRFTPSLFAQINSPDSLLYLLIGSKKFIEGWSSWRVSTMGLLNMGKGQGPQVIQLFGRGVRLKGKNWTLKRSSHLSHLGPHPAGITILEDLSIFGWNADYIQAFRQIIKDEEIPRELQIPIQVRAPFPKLPIPQPRKGYRVDNETWTLLAEKPFAELDVTPEVAYLESTKDAVSTMEENHIRVDFEDERVLGLLDQQRLYSDLLEYKALRGYGNIFIPKSEIVPILQASSLRVAQSDANDLEFLQEAAERLLRVYLDKFIARKEREAESGNIEPAVYLKENIVTYYTLRAPADLLKDIQVLLQKKEEIYTSQSGKPLPRLYVDEHLYNPILLDPSENGVPDLAVSPPGLKKSERKFVEDIINFWKSHRNEAGFKSKEVTLLRNPPKTGVGFFRRSGFYPDFILWINDKKTKEVVIRFVEPHGMHHGGLSGNSDKIESFKHLDTVSQAEPFKEKNIRLDGFILTETELKDIPGAEALSEHQLRTDHKTIRQEGDYCKILMAS